MDTGQKKSYWTFQKVEWFKKDLKSFMYEMTISDLVNYSSHKNVCEAVYNLCAVASDLQRKGAFGNEIKTEDVNS